MVIQVGVYVFAAILVAVTAASSNLISAQAPPNFVLWSFISPAQFYPTCLKVVDGVGKDTANKALAESSCTKQTTFLGGAATPAHCAWAAGQMEAATLQEAWRGGPDFCTRMLMYHSNKLKIDLLKYLRPTSLWNVCTNSIHLAIQQAAGAIGPVAAVQANLPVTCKQELEETFRKNGMPYQIASEGCKFFVPKADKALSAKELEPTDTKQFCDGNSMQSLPFAKSQPSPMPEGFPLTLSDWTPKVTLAKLRELVRSAFGTPRDAFAKFDTDGDGSLNQKEWDAMCTSLRIPGMDCQILKPKLDTNKDGRISEAEWDTAMGVTLPELVQYVLDKHKNGDAAWKVFDSNGDGKVTPAEWQAHCAEVQVTPKESKPLFGEVDKSADGGIDKQEFADVFGVSLPEMKRRAREKYGSPEASFKAFDANGDGNIDLAEFEKGCAILNIPASTAKKLMAEMDIDASGGISPEEWDQGMEMTKEEVKQKVFEALGHPEDVLKDLDPDGDGIVDMEDLKKKLEDAGLSKEEAEAVVEAIDKDGDGKISAEEFKEQTGAKDLEGVVGPGAGTAAMTGNPGGPFGQGGKEGMCATCTGGAGTLPNGEKEVTMPELMKRAQDTHGTPKAAYEAMDRDGDGNITPEEFEKGCANLKPPVSPAQAAPLFDKFDKDESGGVTPEEFYDEAGGKDKFTPLSLPELKRRLRDKFGSPKEAFAAMDKDGDGKVSPEEFAEACKSLKPPLTPKQAESLFPTLDKDGSGDIRPEELFELVGGPDEFAADMLTLPEFKKRAKATHGTPKAAFSAFDKDGDGKVSAEEFIEGCKNLQPAVSPQEASPLFKQLDGNGDGTVSPEEWYDAVGPPDAFTTSPGDPDHVALPEYMKRAKAKNATPKEAFDAMDADGDGQVTPDEFIDACGKLDPPIPKEAAIPLFKQLDKDDSGAITPEEYYDAVGPADGFVAQPGDPDYVTIPELKKRSKEKHGTPEAAFKAMDKDGDGEVTEEEFVAYCKQLEPPMTESEAIPLFRELDANGNDAISPAEWYATVGPPDAFAASKGDPNYVDVPEFKERAKATHGTPRETFAAMDTNKDGMVTPEEFIAACAKLKPPISKEAAVPLFQELDKDGNGHITPEEFYESVGSPEEFAASAGEAGAPRTPAESAVSPEEARERMKQAFGNGKDIWDAIAGPNATEITPDQFKEKMADLGIPPGEAEKLFKEMDKNGDGKISADEFQNTFGVDEAEMKDRLLEKYGNVDKALEAADKDGDGKVSEEELVKQMTDDLGITPENAKKLAKDIMKKYDPDGDGKINGKDYKKAFMADADDVKDRIAEKIGSAGDALKKWDKDGDGCLSKEEFLAGAMKDLGISKGAAETMWKEHDNDGDGKMCGDEFIGAFGVGPNEVMAKCFEKFGNPEKGFYQGDVNQDGVLSPEEWNKIGEDMGFKDDQIKRLFKEMDTNNGENTQNHVSMWEFFVYLDYEVPASKTWHDGYGDIDPFGVDHKKFNKLSHKELSQVPAKNKTAPTKALLHNGTTWQVVVVHEVNATNATSPHLDKMFKLFATHGVSASNASFSKQEKSLKDVAAHDSASKNATNPLQTKSLLKVAVAHNVAASNVANSKQMLLKVVAAHDVVVSKASSPQQQKAFMAPSRNLTSG